MNASKRYLSGGGVVVVVIGLIVGAIRPSKHAQAAPTTVPDIEVVQVQQQDVPIVRPFPDKPYFRPVLEVIQSNPVTVIEKSRDMMMSWFCVGYFTHAAMTNNQREVLFQSQKEDKAAELIDYAKTLYGQQDERLRRKFPLTKPLANQPALKLEFANGSRLIGIPEGADQIRSYHPWGLLMDEAAFQPETGEAYDDAVPVCQRIIVVSSAGPGWFADFVTDQL